MWAIMMIAMMLPSGASYDSDFRRGDAHRQRLGIRMFRLSIFVAGYVAIWCVFSASPPPRNGGCIGTRCFDINDEHERVVRRNVTARGWRFSIQPAEEHLSHPCRGPLEFIMTRWREGGGAHFEWDWTRPILRRLLLGFDALLFVAGV